jgi:hypothetical protein
MKTMTPEFDYRIADWLEDDPDKAPSIVLSTVVGALPSIPQRPTWRSLLRSPQTQRFAFAGVVVLVAAIGVGGWWAGRNTNNVGGSPAPTPTLAPTPTPSPAATPRTLTGLDQGSNLGPGTYRIGGPFMPFTITTASNSRLGQHEANILHIDGYPVDGQGNVFVVSLDFLRPQKVFADACDSETAADVGSSIDDLVSALTSIEGYTAGPVEDVTVDGLAAKTFTLDSSLTPERCPDGFLLLTFDRFGLDEAFGSFGGHNRIWVLEVNGEPVVIDVRTADDPTAEQQAQAEEIVDAIDFD